MNRQMEKVAEVIEKLNVSDYSTDAVESAVTRLESIAFALDSIKAEFNVTYDGSVITIIVEPKLSYDKTVFQIEVEDRRLSSVLKEESFG